MENEYLGFPVFTNSNGYVKKLKTCECKAKTAQ